MSDAWHSLYLRVEDFPDTPTAAAALQDALSREGYQPYDPFAGGSGTPISLKTFVKCLVAPPQDGWIRILGEPGNPVKAMQTAVVELSAGRPILWAWLSGKDEGGLTPYRDGQLSADGLGVYLRPDKTADDLARALGGTMPTVIEVSSGGMLPDDIQRLAQKGNVDSNQAAKMMDRITSQLFGKLDRASGGEASTMQDQARALAMGGNRVDWNSPAGQRLRALATVLMFPTNWREPDFGAVRDAYQAARMLRKNPRAMLMPDEQAALKAIPNANDYEAVYVGK